MSAYPPRPECVAGSHLINWPEPPSPLILTTQCLAHPQLNKPSPSRAVPAGRSRSNCPKLLAPSPSSHVRTCSRSVPLHTLCFPLDASNDADCGRSTPPFFPHGHFAFCGAPKMDCLSQPCDGIPCLAPTGPFLTPSLTDYVSALLITWRTCRSV